MKKIVDKVKSINEGIDKRELLNSAAMVLLLSVFMANITVVAYAEGTGWGKNFYNEVKDIIYYVALAFVVFQSAKFIMKRAWVQFGGFAVLASIILFIIGSPESLKTIGSTIWNIIF